MAFDPFAALTIHLTESPLPSPLSLAGLVEATFPGYRPSPIAQSQFSRIETGLSALKTSATFFNEGITGSANPTAAFLVSGQGMSAQLVSVVLLQRGSFQPINHGAFTLMVNFAFSSSE